MIRRRTSSRSLVLLLVPLLAAASVAGAQARTIPVPRDAAREAMLTALEKSRGDWTGVAQRIWGFAEVGYQETKSSALLQERLAAAGFTVRAGVADIPTAFTAEYGSGKPVIAIIGEFDALPGLSQDTTAGRKPLSAGAPGHGCGHHLLGTASAAAAVAVKDWLIATKRAGTVRFYGTPAEEGGGGKVYMIRAGLFKDVDAVIAWHPGDQNQVGNSTSLANINGKFRFHGLSAHAASAPDEGRSALDGVEAMNAMVNLMREHVPQEARIHYVITDGGKAPNVVPDFAEVYYYARHQDMRVLEGIWERIVNAAKGAALGTGTTMDVEVLNAVYNMLPNDYLAGVMDGALRQVGGYTYTAEERAFAEKMRTQLPPTAVPIDDAARVRAMTQELNSASTDLGDVSWIAPTVELDAATWVPGTSAHSWQAVAAGGTSIGAQGMMVAAKTIALTAAELFSNPRHVQQARAEFDRRVAGFRYASRVGDRKPPLDYRK